MHFGAPSVYYLVILYAKSLPLEKSLLFTLTIELSLFPGPIKEHIFVKKFAKERTS